MVTEISEQSRAYRHVAGIDEAGRGPVIGPLVIAGVLMNEDQVHELVEIGVKDSKLLSPELRTELSGKILKIATKVVYDELSPAEIDETVMTRGKHRRLNFLEAVSMARLIAGMRPDAVWVDASDVNPNRYAQQIIDNLPADLKEITLISEHKADRRYPVVSAASIMAKVKRDLAITVLWREYGNFGSGYPSDPKTIAFLRSWRCTHKRMPPIARRSWKTVRNISADLAQTRLD